LEKNGLNPEKKQEEKGGCDNKKAKNYDKTKPYLNNKKGG